MKPILTGRPIVRLPAEVQISVFLIREELKSRKLFGLLQQAGLVASDLQPHLDKLIMYDMGIDDEAEEVFLVYNAIMESRSSKIRGYKSIMKQALKAYHELKDAKKRFQKKG